MHDPVPTDHAAAPALSHDVRRLGPAARAELRRDLVAQAYKLRQEHPEMTVIDIARQLGRSESTVRKYFSDPTATKARERKQTYRGTCATEGCENPTSAGDGRGRARDHCRSCENASRRVHSQASVIETLRRFEAEAGRPARSSDFHPTRARDAGGDAWERYQRYGLALATIRRVFSGGFAAAAAAAYEHRESAAASQRGEAAAWKPEADGTSDIAAAQNQPSSVDELAWAA